MRNVFMQTVNVPAYWMLILLQDIKPLPCYAIELAELIDLRQQLQ